MPYTVKKLKNGKSRVSSPNGVKAKASTPANAKKQVRLLNAIDHGYDPEKARASLKRKVMS